MKNKNIIVLKTDIQSQRVLRLVSSLFDTHNAIIKWSVDLEDCDNVLRVITYKKINALDLISQLKTHGITAKDLPS